MLLKCPCWYTEELIVDNTSDLRVLLTSPGPVVMVEATEEERFMGLVQEIASERGMQVWTWSSASGLANWQGSQMYQTENPHKALAWITDVRTPAVFVFVDAHPILADPQIVRRIKETARQLEPTQTMVFTAPAHDIPAELVAEARLWKLRPPSHREIMQLMADITETLNERGFPVAITEDDMPAIARTLQGLSTREAERIIQDAALHDGALSESDLPAIRNAKAELFAADGILELVESDVGTLDQVGGLDGLRKWLSVRRRAQDAQELGLPSPRGVLLTGIPGCGKSLVAKTLARTWGQPLVLLDPGRLYSKYIGESEARLGKALEAVGAMSPAVLWIDEIEKGFATGGSADGGVSTRLLGSFLRWMQERPDGVFVVATANDVRSLPPEFLRKGRFDEIFFVDLPDHAARKSILRLHLEQRRLEPASFPLDTLAAITVGFSGAEIEAGIVGGLYHAFAEGGELDADALAAQYRTTVPLSVSRAEQVTALRAWAETRAVLA